MVESECFPFLNAVALQTSNSSGSCFVHLTESCIHPRHCISLSLPHASRPVPAKLKKREHETLRQASSLNSHWLLEKHTKVPSCRRRREEFRIYLVATDYSIQLTKPHVSYNLRRFISECQKLGISRIRARGLRMLYATLEMKWQGAGSRARCA